MNRIEFTRLLNVVPFIQDYTITETGNRILVEVKFKWYFSMFSSAILNFLKEYFTYLSIPGTRIVFMRKK